VSQAFLEVLRSRPGEVDIEEVDVFRDDLPRVAGDNIEAKYTVMAGHPIDPNHAESWLRIEQLIAQFKSADAYLISAPMWNLSVPYALKYYIDCIVQPSYTFRYNEVGQVVPLVVGKKMLCVTSRGGDYSPGTPSHPYDFQEPYLRGIFGFIGITDINFIHAQTMDITAQMRESSLAAAIDEARALAAAPDWSAPL
jgi:FMN-dependent NADH-azoreductase